MPFVSNSRRQFVKISIKKHVARAAKNNPEMLPYRNAFYMRSCEGMQKQGEEKNKQQSTHKHETKGCEFSVRTFLVSLHV